MPRLSILPLIGVLSALLFTLTSCIALESFPGKGSTPAPTPKSPADLALSQADNAVRSQKYAEAARLYESFLTSFPEDSRKEYALSAAGKASDLAGSYEAAIRDYQNLILNFPGGGFAKEAKLRLPQLYLYTGNFQEALNSSISGATGQRDQTSKANLLLMGAKAKYLLGDYLGAAQSFAQAAVGLTGAAHDDARNGLFASFAHLNQLELNDFAKKGGESFPGPEAVWFMAYLSHASGDQNSFLAQAQYFKTYFPTHPWGPQLDALAMTQGVSAITPPGSGFNPRAQVAGPVLVAPPLSGSASLGPLSQTHTVAALLPLSGTRNTNLAVQILSGLRLAASHSGGTLNVVEYDTQGLPANAVRLTSEISQNPSIIAIVGPLNSDEALAAAQTAQQSSMPIITISTRIGLVTSRPYVFRVFLTYEAQAQAVARYAVTDKGHKLLGVLYPDDLYGNNMLRYFEAEVMRLGAQISTRESYKSPGGDYAEAANRLTGGAGARQVSTSYQAATNFTTLYIPESPSVVSQILPFLAFNDLTKMEYLGTSLWAVPDFPKAAGKYLAGSVIPVAFSPLSQRPEAKAFLEAYRTVAGQDPDQFAVYGYDAGLAILAALSTGIQSREALINALRQLPPIPGASGPFTFDTEGEYQVSPLLLTVSGSEFKLLKDSAPH
ncbi:MAG: ABC transporter substrate-binding protein [Deltaproteobacteria bacterium]|nr:ABC transporter substrate-binding protein [Deltaproteobacteria bacterium]